MHHIMIWDLPTRIFHWALVLAVSIAIATGLAGNTWMEIHAKAGLTIFGLLVFRLMWGFLGNPHARFSDWLQKLKALPKYLHAEWNGTGHNPMGVLSVISILVLLSFQVATGLVGTDEISFNGPLSHLVSEELSVRFTGWHQILSNLLFAWIGLHLAAILFYQLVKKDNLIGSMINGNNENNTPSKLLEASAPIKRPWVAIIFALMSAFLAVWLASGTTFTKGLS